MRFFRYLIRNVSIKIVALLVAALIWFYAVLDRPQTAGMDLPVTVGRIPPGMQVVAIDTGRAQAQLAGKGRDLLLLKLRKPAFRLNLTNDIPGRARVKLGQDQSNLPATVQLVSARPEYVNVDVDQQARRLVRVSVPTRGKPARGYVVTSVRSLDNVYLTGPQEEIGLVTAVNTDSFSVADLSASAQHRVRVLPPPGRRYRPDPESVNVAVKVEPEESRTFADVAVNVFKSRLISVTVKPAKAQITVSGAADPVRALTLQGISATLRVTDTVARGRHQLPCEITLPPGISLVKCDPPVFDVEVH